MLLSVIIPFYQVENYISKCLEQVAILPAEETEILLVDDCGKDHSADIAKAFAESHHNARILKQKENGGLSSARNLGFDAAQGEYVYYLDSDDVPYPEALFSAVRFAKENALDIVKGKFVYLNDRTGEITQGAGISKTGCTAGKDIFAAQSKAGCYEPMVWQCIYRREFLNEIRLKMPVGLLFEDELFQAPALIQAKRAACVDECFLQYRIRPGSIMGSFSNSSEWCFSYMQICRQLGTFARKLEEGEAKRMLKRRIGQIALSTAKNISAYHLLPKPAEEAVKFVRSHKKELSQCAIRSGDMKVALQGILLSLSPELFLRVYPEK